MFTINSVLVFVALFCAVCAALSVNFPKGRAINWLPWAFVAFFASLLIR